MAQFIVGIDLGTTNCAVSYVEAEAEDATVQSFAIPQLIEAGTVEERSQLPSFLFAPAAHDVKDGALELPWDSDAKVALGVFARDRGAERPNRLVSSAKSWLSHAGVDRKGPILPWQSDEEDLEKVSPVEVSTRLLTHLRQAWDASSVGKNAPLADQEVYLTVPASFDAVARELTVSAANEAGLGSITLLEEPLAAFYSWLHSQGDDWRKQVEVGHSILVCDVGGGTTDFSLIEAKEEDGNLSLERTAVGEHILLGGDNMDLALAQLVATKVKDKKLDPWQSRALWYSCREAKEKLLSDPDLESFKIRVLSKGRKLIGKTLKAELTREDLGKVLIDGFFPVCASEDRPVTAAKSGMRQLGLPYARDAAVTKHLAKFLGDREGDFVHPHAILVNGGVLKGDAIRDRLQEVVGAWAKKASGPEPKLLAGTDLDLAVATGAACYGLAKRGKGIRVREGAARAYYVGVESAMPAVPGFEPPLQYLCVVPFGMEAGTDSEVPGREYGLVTGEPVEFRLFSSVTREEDKIGQVIDDELEETSPLQSTLEAQGLEPGSTVAVRLSSSFTEVGTLELSLKSTDGQHDWKLSFDLRETDEENG